VDVIATARERDAQLRGHHAGTAEGRIAGDADSQDYTSRP